MPVSQGNGVLRLENNATTIVPTLMRMLMTMKIMMFLFFSNHFIARVAEIQATNSARANAENRLSKVHTEASREWVRWVWLPRWLRRTGVVWDRCSEGTSRNGKKTYFLKLYLKLSSILLGRLSMIKALHYLLTDFVVFSFRFSRLSKDT